MSDMGDDFRAYKAANKMKKAENLASSLKLLEDNGIEYTTSNGGIHCMITTHKGIIDFWPSTGLWIKRWIKNDQKRGVWPLIRAVKWLQERKEPEVPKGDPSCMGAFMRAAPWNLPTKKREK